MKKIICICALGLFLASCYPPPHGHPPTPPTPPHPNDLPVPPAPPAPPTPPHPAR